MVMGPGVPGGGGPIPISLDGLPQVREAIELQKKAVSSQIATNMLSLAIGSYAPEDDTRSDTVAVLARAQAFFDFVTADRELGPSE